MRRAALAVLLAATVACARERPASRPKPSPSGRPSVVLSAGEATVSAEVAATPQDRSTGLMHRPSMAEDAGMLFLFPLRHSGAFWMRNTLIPLSIAFMERSDETFTVLAILDMQPCPSTTADADCPTYGPGREYDAALEVNLGWFDRHEVRAGETFRAQGRLPDTVP